MTEDPYGRSPGYERQRAQRRELREMGNRLRIENEASVRTVLDRHFPAGFPSELVEGLCRISNSLIAQLVTAERTHRQMHDGINRIANEADQRWVDGFTECAERVRRTGEGEGLAKEVIDRLLVDHLSMLVNQKENEKLSRDREASRQVEWIRD